MSSRAQTWQMLDWGLQNRVNEVYVDTAANLLYAVGYFNNASGLAVNRFAVWDGTSWSTLAPGFNGVAFDVTVYQGEIYVVGQFTTPTSFIAKWNGSAWVSVGGGINNIAVDLEVINNELYVGGVFTQAGGNSANRIAKWDGTSWSNIGVGFNSSVQEITEYNGELIATGQFLQSGSTVCEGIARWDGSQWQALGGSTNGDVYATYIDTLTNELYIGGNFGLAGGTTATRLAKWDGTTWSAVANFVGSGQVNCINQYGGDLIVGGTFQFAGGTGANDYLARWDGTTYQSMGGGFNNFTTVIDYYDGKLLVGGEFTWSDPFNNLAQHIVTWNAPPPIAGFVMSSDTLCLDESVTFSDTSTGVPTSRQWSFPGGTPATSTSANPTVNYTAAGSYDVQLIVSNFEGTDTINMLNAVTVLGTLTNYTVSNDTSVCTGNCSTLLAAGATNYNWSVAGVSTSTAASFTACPTQTTSYVVRLRTGTTCAVDTVVLAVNSLPTLSIAGTDSICNGQSATLTATGAASYAWASGSNANPYTVMPTTTSTYQVTGTDANGCTNTMQHNIYVGTNPTAQITGNTIICAGTPTDLTASGGANYQWSTGQQTATITIAPSASLNYEVIVFASDGCIDTTNAQVTVNPLPAVAITGDTVICAGDTTNLTGNAGTTFQWSTGDLTQSIAVHPSATQAYSLIVFDANACSDTASVQVTVNPLPSVAIAGDSVICAGDTATLMGSAGTNYQWSTGDQTQVVEVAPTTTQPYSLTITDANNCSNTAATQVVVNPLPMPPGITQIGPELHSTQAVSYTWYNFTNDSVGTGPIFDPPFDGDYYVVVTDSNGCSAQSILVTFIWVGLAEYNKSALFNIYPNPTTAEFKLAMRGTTVAQSVKVYNINGRLVYQVPASDLNATTVQINIGRLSKGMYTVEVITKEGRAVQRIILH